jgi:hypothetical protein
MYFCFTSILGNGSYLSTEKKITKIGRAKGMGEQVRLSKDVS